MRARTSNRSPCGSANCVLLTSTTSPACPPAADSSSAACSQPTPPAAISWGALTTGTPRPGMTECSSSGTAGHPPAERRQPEPGGMPWSSRQQGQARTPHPLVRQPNT